MRYEWGNLRSNCPIKYIERKIAAKIPFLQAEIREFAVKYIYTKKSIQNTRGFYEIIYILKLFFCIYIFSPKMERNSTKNIYFRAIDFYLRHHNSSKAEDLLVNKPGYQELLSSYFKPQSQEINDWLNAPFEQNPKYPGNKIHKTSSGNLVRSKSEALIDMILYTNKIPFRYECALRVGDYTIYPDYTIH